MTFNIHFFSHLAKSIKLWGPSWAYSAFPFKSINGKLLTLVKGIKGVANLIVTKFLLFRSIPYLSSKYMVKENVLRTQGFKMLSMVTILRSLTMEVCILLHRQNGLPSVQIPDEVVVHKRMIKGGLVYSSRNYMQSDKMKAI